MQQFASKVHDRSPPSKETLARLLSLKREEIDAKENALASFTLPVDSNLSNIGGNLHGGAVACAVESALTRSSNETSPNNHSPLFVTTMDISYLKPTTKLLKVQISSLDTGSNDSTKYAQAYLYSGAAIDSGESGPKKGAQSSI